jgi:two-component system chemotaxis response regulator CheY
MKNYDLHNIKVLAVDDNDYVRVLLRRVLNSLGVSRVGEAKNGQDAYKQLHTSKPDIIFCDWEMKPLNGLEFIRMIRSSSDSPYPMVPVVMLSSYTEIRYVEEARDAGANGYLAKPISPKLLYQRICNVIENHGRFIRSETYIGPDRRYVSSNTYAGQDRRGIKTEMMVSSDTASSVVLH